MSYRVCRKTTSKTFRVNDHLCKIFLEPMEEYLPGRWTWNVGFAVGKSRRQLNDWYYRRKNKRRRSLHLRIPGKAGLKTIASGFDQLLLLRWAIRPGDALQLDCTSREPEKQFKAWKRWRKYHPDIYIDEERKLFIWIRPPYEDLEFSTGHRIIPLTPPDKRVCWGLEGHDLSFDVVQVIPHRRLSMERIAPQESQALQSESTL